MISTYVTLYFDLRLKAILHACWHMITVTLFFTVIIFWAIGMKPDQFAFAQFATVLGGGDSTWNIHWHSG